MIKRFFLTLLFLSGMAQAQSKTADSEAYGVYFTAFPWTINEDFGGDTGQLWLEAIRDDWGATGVQLYAIWSDIEPTRNVFNWTDFDAALLKILNAGLDVNILVRMGSFLPDWAEPDSEGQYQDKEFHTDKFGEIIAKGSDGTSDRYFHPSSSLGTDRMKIFYEKVVLHVKDTLVVNTPLLYDYEGTNHHSGRARRPIEFTPSINLTAEFELDSDWRMTGYSALEKTAFITYLKAKYDNDISRLEAAWGDTLINSFTIDPANYNWHLELVDSDGYDLLPGRIDWLSFKSEALLSLANEFADITNTNGFRMGIQFGSIYDKRLDFRGYFDATPFMEKAYGLRVADIPGFRDYFNFSADFSRSICEYWDDQPGSIHTRRGFSSETNWHLSTKGFAVTDPMVDPLASSHEVAANDLSDDFEDQMMAFYDEGADYHVIFGWGNVQARWQFWATSDGERPDPVSSITKDDLLVGNLTIIDTSGTNDWYHSFTDAIKTLTTPSSPSRQSPSAATRAIHYSSAYFSTIPVDSGVINGRDTFYMPKAIMNKNYSNPNDSYPSISSDIVTDYMIEHTPDYLSNYSDYSLTESSNWMSDSVYLALLTTEIDDSQVEFINATRILDNGHGEYVYTPALYNEVGTTRSPIHLIWRSRSDLRALFPDAHLPDSAEAASEGWNDSKDFIYWAKRYGSEAAHADTTEYPGWEIFADTIYAYDPNIKSVWDSRSDLNSPTGAFPDGHYGNSSVTSLVSMIEWVKKYGYLERPDPLANYNSWPYIGQSYTASISGAAELGSGQSATYTSSVAGGSGSYTYQWSFKEDGGSWVTLGTGTTQSVTMDGTDLTVKLLITDTSTDNCAQHEFQVQYNPKAKNSITNNTSLSTSIIGNYPNPFNPSTTIRFALAERSDISLIIYNALGQKVNILVEESVEAGEYSISWNGTDDSGQRVASGIYFLRLEAGNIIQTRKMLMIE
ncbi:MAG: FlgD immunoglobulin-like domain containing protein [Calditrichia bacterium]